MADHPSYDFYAALRTILARVGEAEARGSDSEDLQRIRLDALSYLRQLDALRAALDRWLAETAEPARSGTRQGPQPSKRLACHHADSADALKLIEGDLPPWMIDCSEPH